MTKGNPVRFGGGGPYSLPFAIIEEARDEFFRAVGRVCPNAFRDLRKAVLPVYEAWWRGADEATRASAVPRNLTLLETVAPQVAEAVSGWCSKWHLAGVVEEKPEDAHSVVTREYETGQGELIRQTIESWTGYGEDWDVVARARARWPGYWVVATLAAWSDPKTGPKMLASDPPELPHSVFFFSADRAPVTVEFQILPWQGREDVERFRGRVRAAADAWIQKYLKARREQLERFMVRAPGKHSLEHLEWLALYQVGGLADHQIKPKYPGIDNESTISKGIHAVAELIGLNVRRAPAPNPRRRRVRTES